MIPFQVLCEELTYDQTYNYFHISEKVFSLLTDEDKALVYIEMHVPGYRLFYPKEKWIQSLHHTALRYKLDAAIESSDFAKITFIKNEIKRRREEDPDIDIKIEKARLTAQQIADATRLTNICRICKLEYPVKVIKRKRGICSTCEDKL